MTRRELLTTSAGALLAGTLPLSAAEQAVAKRKRPIKIAVKYGMIADGKTALEKFKIAQDAGFEGIEPNGPLEPQLLEDMGSACQSTGMLISGLVCPGGGRDMGALDEATRAKGIETMAETLRQTKQLGGTTVLMYPGKVEKELPYHLVYQALIDSTKAALPYTEETGVKIALENVWNNIFISPMDAVHFLDTINSPNVGWFFDMGNIARYGWPEHWVKALGKRIFKLDIKGFSTTKYMKEGPWAGFKTEIGEDEIDWAAVMKALDEVPYTGGWISAEVNGGDVKRLTQVRQQIDKILSL